jgi:glutaredoxin 3
MPSVRIFGKDSCPYTMRAKDAFTAKGYDVEYVNVRKDPNRIAEMLKLSGGRRAVPVIDEDGKVTIGFGGT